MMKKSKHNMAAALSTQDIEKKVMADTLLSYFVHPVQYTEVRLAPLTEKGNVFLFS